MLTAVLTHVGSTKSRGSPVGEKEGDSKNREGHGNAVPRQEGSGPEKREIAVREGKGGGRIALMTSQYPKTGKVPHRKSEVQQRKRKSPGGAEAQSYRIIV